MMGLMWASTVIPLIEQGVIMKDELIQIASEKCFSPTIPPSWLPQEVFHYEDQEEEVP